MSKDPFKKQLNRGQLDHDIASQFREERLANRELHKSQWPAVIDNAALDLIHGVALGHTQSRSDIGATIDPFSFPKATGRFYHDGLRALAGSREGLASAIQQYDGETMAKFAYRILDFRESLRGGNGSLDLDRGIEALLQKLSTRALETDDSITDIGLGTKLQHRGSVADLLLQLFSDPEVESFASNLFRVVNDEIDSNSLIQELDRPQMTTVLWEHQREALREWVHSGQTGYVDMATATGKTVLGLAAIAIRYGDLHPQDQRLVMGSKDSAEVQTEVESPNVLVVAGNQVLLNQWHRQFDEHLDIPRARTTPEQFEETYEVSLDWGRLEFQTAQALSSRDVIGSYDLVILDEAHRYSRGSRDSRRWGDVFDDLAERSNSILAMSGSIEMGWQGDSSAKDALEEHLNLCHRYGLHEAKQDGVIADFDWVVRYALPPQEDEEKLSTYSQVMDKYLDLESGELAVHELNVDLGSHPNEFPSHNALRSFMQTKEGSRQRNRSDKFDFLATTLLTRRTTQWNLSVDFASISDILSTHLQEKSVVLVQSYEESTSLQEYLDENFGDSLSVMALHGRSDEINDKIQRFNNMEEGVLIGPGKLLGTGIDLPDAEVAINIAQGNVSTSLVQRIGRVLRNPSDDKHALFYHLVPQPIQPESVLPREDGHRLILQAAEFLSLGNAVGKEPKYSSFSEEVNKMVHELRQAGANHIRDYPTIRDDASGPDVDQHIDYILTRVESTRGEVKLSVEWYNESSGTPANDREEIVEPGQPSDLSEDDRMEIEWLERVALDNTSDPQAISIRLSAVERLARFGKSASSSLKMIADDDVCDHDKVRNAAKEHLGAS